mmetsp:Transcript_10527/g.64598  ORF Transcript_10527/g.64598 Transcript_10527/m.64598 type:complete len:208 (+) Transcript_10527:3134-3757(+)
MGADDGKRGRTTQHRTICKRRWRGCPCTLGRGSNAGDSTRGVQEANQPRPKGETEHCAPPGQTTTAPPWETECARNKGMQTRSPCKKADATKEGWDASKPTTLQHPRRNGMKMHPNQPKPTRVQYHARGSKFVTCRTALRPQILPPRLDIAPFASARHRARARTHCLLPWVSAFLSPKRQASSIQSDPATSERSSLYTRKSFINSTP